MDLASTRRRVLTVALGVMGLTAVSQGTRANEKARKRRKREKAKRSRCQSGPCTYESCLLYADVRFPLNAGVWEAAMNRVVKRDCCSYYALSYEGKKYRDAAIACMAAPH